MTDTHHNSQQHSVMAAEDNKANQMVLKKLLKKKGIEPIFVNNGQEAVDLYQSSPEQWSLIFMDCEMPIMDGYTATENIRQYEIAQQLSSCIIIGLSAHALNEFRSKALDKGMTEYLTKPIDRDLLYAIIDKYMPDE
ncbi:Signal transduction histidine-protein kinase BarA [invertebrate metagenome]|uniref:Signal transduction histidine-protein kinase BarA n=1 Tax=invertebrate metagenome TaxID=1711999 RepID=A0A2H9T427_9ZZZZ